MSLFCTYCAGRGCKVCSGTGGGDFFRYRHLREDKYSNSKGATLSGDGQYRYALWRTWDGTKPRVMFIMLNPSMADALEDDPTIRRCLGYAKSWGYGGLLVGNLFAFRSPNPKDLLAANDPNGPRNDDHLVHMINNCDLIVCAWGNPSVVRKLMKHNEHIVQGMHANYLQRNQDGTPAHPLYLKKDIKPKRCVIDLDLLVI